MCRTRVGPGTFCLVYEQRASDALSKAMEGAFMSIVFQETCKTITLSTVNTLYQMQVDHLGHLQHLYYGRKVGEDDMGYQYFAADRAFSPYPYQEKNKRCASLDIMPQEYTGYNTGDYRVGCLEVSGGTGMNAADFTYVSHEIRPGKYQVEGMPSVYDEGGQAETLIVCLADQVTGLRLELYYGVFEKEDIITRSARIVNGTEQQICLEKAASICLDIPFGSWDMIHFHGRHAMERQMERVHLPQTITTVQSKRGVSSHHHNPFVILCDASATEEQGDCYGFMLEYSGNHRTDVEINQMGSTRVVMGINDELFSWNLAPGGAFAAPEVILVFSSQGLGHLSRLYHHIIRHNVCRGQYKTTRRPVLINNWEATYFDFTADKIYEIAKMAAELGVELMVLDDGWFGQRFDDNRALGDWYVNEEKLPGGLKPLIDRINGLGMKFGIWIEPEMISENSDLYRAHPDWALAIPGRLPALCRNQLVLDMSRPEVVDYLYERISGLLRDNHIEYIKWDMNRNLTDVYSNTLPAGKQGEVSHRYVLGLYSLMERLTTEFPHVLFEGCSGGGGRFDAGMLAYSPQIWCSDDTDAIERLTIQHGTSFGYPVSAMGAHVSASPNHQTGRGTPLGTRAVVAMSGTFGYELDINKLSDEEKEEVRGQVKFFKEHYGLIQDGDYYRLSDPAENKWYTAWEFAAADGSEALVNVVLTHSLANSPNIHLKVKGLDPDARYRIASEDYYGAHLPWDLMYSGKPTIREERTYSGSALMYAGFTLPMLYGNYPSGQIHFVRI